MKRSEKNGIMENKNPPADPYERLTKTNALKVERILNAFRSQSQQGVIQ